MVLKKSSLLLPLGYDAKMDVRETEIAIKAIKDVFEKKLSEKLNLTRVSAPLFVKVTTGLNDNLNGIERPVGFDVKDTGDDVEIVQSLAKWKRIALGRYGFGAGEGLYTDMNAIRRDEELDNIHSIYVDQWDWEKVIKKEDRKIETLKETVEKIFAAFKETEDHMYQKYPFLGRHLPEEIHFITSEELLQKYPDLTPKDRETAIAKEKKAVFIIGIGEELSHGEKHDGRAPDYDDWTMNGDIIFWNPVLESALELSSMGIRVDEEALERQLLKADAEDRKKLDFHRDLLDGKLPYTIGGGIGQSRICMYFLRRAHIGEVQASIWPEEMISDCEEKNIFLL